ncbi:MAG: hypothetical protein MJE68_27655 [Proteobacteria bacterium]|nr:hypothetical protein [Pseudomonadota bacterium]
MEIWPMGEVEQLAMFDSFPKHLTSSSTTGALPPLRPFTGIAVDSASQETAKFNVCMQLYSKTRKLIAIQFKADSEIVPI